MGLLSHRVERSDLKKGDHIYTYRTAYTYSHHGIYVDEDRVLHFTQDQNWNWSSSVNSSSMCFSSPFCSSVNPCSSSPFCGFKKDKSGVTMSCLDCFMRNGSLCRYEYGVGRCAFMAKRGGTCTTANSDDPVAVINRAMHLFCNGFGKYDLLENNCEDFALYCKTGLRVIGAQGSSQVLSVMGFPGAAISALPVRLFCSNLVVLGAATTVSYFITRYYSDIGLRSDVVKVVPKDK